MLLFLKQLILKVRQYKIIIDVKYICVCVCVYAVKPKCIQTPSTFLTTYFKLCQNKFILIMSDNFDRKVCNE